MMDRKRGAVAGAVASLGVVALLLTNLGAASSQIDSENIYSICLKVQAVCEDPSPGTTTTLPPTTSSTTSTTIPPTTSTTGTTAPTTTTTQPPLQTVNISVTPFANGTRAHVQVDPNNGATVVVRNPSGTVISRGATGDIPANICCTTPGTYTWVADPITPGFVASPGSGSFVAGTTTTAPTTTTTTSPTTTTTTPSGVSYVNPLNTGAHGSLGTYSGPLNFTSGTHTVENVVVNGEVRVCGNANVTFRNVLISPTSSNAGGRVFQVDGGVSGCTGSPILTVDHVTIDGNGDSQRGVSAQRGGVARVYFTDISGVEDCFNTGSGTASNPNILVDSYCHDLDSPASGPHYDGVQVMGGYATIHRNVIWTPNSATAAMFSKRDAGLNIVVDVRNNYLNGGGYTLRYGDGSAGSVTGTYRNNEVGPDNNFGPFLAPTNGATADRQGDVQVLYRPGGNGWHPGNQQ